jgi:magnesium chelatase family protein
MQEAASQSIKTDNQNNAGSVVTTQHRALAMVRSRTVVGVTAHPVVVEVHLANGLPSFSTVGLPEAAVKESKDRVRGALINSGFEFPAKRITVNLSPADLPKTGSRFDLPIAIGILAASGQVPAALLDDCEFIGELALDGQLRPIRGVLPTALAAGAAGKALFLPASNGEEAALAEHTYSKGAAHLLNVCEHLTGQAELPDCKAVASKQIYTAYADLADVKGQPLAKRALEIAAAGYHNLLLIGPPGTGKSMLASRLPGIMPPLSLPDGLEAAAIHSVAQGDFDVRHWQRRPFRSPHHSASAAALVGGGSHPRPGEISLAHKGILFLDELTEFSRATLEQLREPLETGVIHISRASQQVEYPADFLLVAACNPCKCGYYGDGTDRCQCSDSSIEKYRSKLSGPLLDRIDIHVYLQRLSARELTKNEQHEPHSETIRTRVTQCQGRQFRRQGCLNSQLAGDQMMAHCALSAETSRFLELACDRLQLSARAYHRILRLARTVADLANKDTIEREHLAEAISFKQLT